MLQLDKEMLENQKSDKIFEEAQESEAHSFI